jgi:hypothetical protein
MDLGKVRSRAGFLTKLFDDLVADLLVRQLAGAVVG